MERLRFIRRSKSKMKVSDDPKRPYCKKPISLDEHTVVYTWASSHAATTWSAVVPINSLPFVVCPLAFPGPVPFVVTSAAVW